MINLLWILDFRQQKCPSVVCGSKGDRPAGLTTGGHLGNLALKLKTSNPHPGFDAGPEAAPLVLQTNTGYTEIGLFVKFIFNCLSSIVYRLPAETSV